MLHSNSQSSRLPQTTSQLPSLVSNPREHFPLWIKELARHAQSLNPRNASRYGALDLVLPAPVLELMPRNRDEDGDALPPVNRTKPDPIHGNAAAGTVALWREESDNYHDYQEAAATLLTLILDSLSISMKEQLEDAATGTMHRTIPEIILWVTERYGTANAADIAQYMEQLHVPIDSSDLASFLAHYSHFRTITQALVRANQPLSIFQSLQIFRTSTQSQPAISTAIERYIQLNPILADQNLADLVIYVTAQLDNITTDAAGFAGAVQARPPGSGWAGAKAGSPDWTAHDIESTRMRLNALERAHKRSSNSDRNIASARGRTGRGTQQYCYLHGYGAHSGQHCRVMLADPSAYPTLKLCATNPTQVTGGTA
jgi:hypothetical protein